jgi:lipoprotein-releasing system permease protein
LPHAAKDEPVKLPIQIALAFMKRKDSLIPNFTTLVSVLGVAVGVASFLVVVTVFNSFENQLKHILMGANPHLMVFKIPSGIPNVQNYQKDLLKKINKPLETVALFEYSEVVISKGIRTAATIMKGIEGSAGASGPDLKAVIAPPEALAALDEGSVGSKSYFDGSSTVAPPLKSVSVILGKGLALKLDAKVGDEVSFVTNPYGGGNKSRLQKLTVKGILSVGLAQYDEKLSLMNFYDSSALFGSPRSAKGIEMRFKNPQDSLVVAREIERKTPYGVKAWQDLNRDLFSQVERDGSAIKIIVLIITLVAAFNIIVTLSLAVVDRTKQISILRSMGANRRFIIAVFVSMGGILGAAGAALGIVLGLFILRLFQGFELGELQAYYFLERIPVDYELKLMLSSFVVAFILSFVSALYPAWKATLVVPLAGLKPGSG